jgi:hypothetical protein
MAKSVSDTCRTLKLTYPSNITTMPNKKDVWKNTRLTKKCNIKKGFFDVSYSKKDKQN